MKHTKVTLIQNICPAYRIRFFQKLAEQVDLVLFYGAGEKNGSWKNAQRIEGFKGRKLWSLKLRWQTNDITIRLVWFPGLFYRLCREKPQIIISEGLTNIVNNIAVWLYCKLFSVPLIIWDSGRKKDKPMGLVRKLVEPTNLFLLKQAGAILTYGSIGKEYFTSIGISPEKIFIAQNTIETKPLIKKSQELRQNHQACRDIRAKLGLNGKKVILYVGALDKNRRVENLISVFDELKGEDPNIALVVIGNGSYGETLIRMANKNKIRDCLFLGRIVHGTDSYFSLSDVVVLPGWNTLATIEAMAMAKPVVTVPYGGVEFEMVVNGKTGFIVERDDLAQLKNCIARLLQNSQLAKTMGRAGQERVKKLTFDNMVEKFLEAIEYVKE